MELHHKSVHNTVWKETPRESDLVTSPNNNGTNNRKRSIEMASSETKVEVDTIKPSEDDHDADETRFQCDECWFVTMNKSELKTHSMQNHSSEMTVPVVGNFPRFKQNKAPISRANKQTVSRPVSNNQPMPITNAQIKTEIDFPPNKPDTEMEITKETSQLPSDVTTSSTNNSVNENPSAEMKEENSSPINITNEGVKDESLFGCANCWMTFTNKMELVVHFQKQHAHLNPESNKSSVTGPISTSVESTVTSTTEPTATSIESTVTSTTEATATSIETAVFELTACSIEAAVIESSAPTFESAITDIEKTPSTETPAIETAVIASETDEPVLEADTAKDISEDALLETSEQE